MIASLPLFKPLIFSALTGTGDGAELSLEVAKRCIEFYWSLFSLNNSYKSQAKNPKWYLFKQVKSDHGVNKLLPTQGVWFENIRHSHVQASVWPQNHAIRPVIQDTLMLGWQTHVGTLLPLLTKETPAPLGVLEFIRWNCRSTCLQRTVHMQMTVVEHGANHYRTSYKGWLRICGRNESFFSWKFLIISL